MEESRTVNVPIKELIEESIVKNGCCYPVSCDIVSFLRRYYIAALNLDFISYDNLRQHIDNFTKRIKLIIVDRPPEKFADEWNIRKFVIDNKTLFICPPDAENEKDYTMIVFQAVTWVLFNVNVMFESMGVPLALTEITAERIYNFDVHDEKGILPKYEETYLGGTKKYKLRLLAGYERYNLLINLFKQICLSSSIAENSVIKFAYKTGYRYSSDRHFHSLRKETGMLNTIFQLHYSDERGREICEQEYRLIMKLQIILNGRFDEIDNRYFVFSTMITNNELRKKLHEMMREKMSGNDET